jgi:hypothetical protein
MFEIFTIKHTYNTLTNSPARLWGEIVGMLYIKSEIIKLPGF